MTAGGEKFGGDDNFLKVVESAARSKATPNDEVGDGSEGVYFDVHLIVP